MKLIERNHYLQKLRDVKDVPNIKVITGVRRSGKSKQMDAFCQEIESEDSNIIHIKLNLKEFESLLLADNLYNYVSKQQMIRLLVHI